MRHGLLDVDSDLEEKKPASSNNTALLRPLM
jgi:hypothetical protein